MAPLEVIGGELGRTGTDSLRTALNILGYKAHHMKSFYEEKQDPDPFYHAYFNRETTDWDKLYENYNAGVDWPTVTFHKELLAKYPDAKVVLTVRNADSWYKSVKNTIHKYSLRADNIDPGHPTYRFARMVNTFLFEGLIGDTDRFEQHEEQVKQMFVDHNEEVKRHVPKDQLLVMELGDGWEKLCKFLGKEIPDVPYPSLNSTTDFQENITKHRKNLQTHKDKEEQVQNKNGDPSFSSPSTKAEIQADANKEDHHRKKFSILRFANRINNKKVSSNDVTDEFDKKVNSNKRVQQFLINVKTKFFLKSS